MSHLFISYSSVDGLEDAVKIADALVAGPPSYPVWLDKRDLRPGWEDWDDQIDEALRACWAVLFLVSPDSVGHMSVCKNEWSRALAYKKPVVPLLLEAGLLLPFGLGSRQFVDFTAAFPVALAALRQHLAWLRSPEGALRELRARLADAYHDLARADDSRRGRVRADVAELERRIADQERQLADPEGAKAAAAGRIAAGIERERQPAEPLAVRATKFVNQPPTVAPSWFQDRAAETRLLGRFLTDDGVRLLVVTGRGGVGKTALVCRALRALEAGRLPDDLGPFEVGGIVYLSRGGRHSVSLDHLHDDLCSLLAADQAETLRAGYRDARRSPASLAEALAEAFPAGPVVVLLDNLEDVMDVASESVADPALAEALCALLAGPQHGLKLIATSRVVPRDLAMVEPARQWRLDVDRGLGHPYAEEMLRHLDADGSLGLRDAAEAELAQARELTRGFPRALEALKAILSADRGATLAELLTRPVPPERVVEVLVGDAFERLDVVAQLVMQGLAAYGAPVPPVAVDYVLQPGEPAVDSAPVLRRLVNAGFAHHDGGRYDLHPVDREHALGRLVPGATPGGAKLSRRSLFRRAAGYYATTRKPREAWRCLDDLSAQLAEFDLRCRADEYAAAADVLASIDFDYLQLWGHYRLAVELHQRLDGNLDDPGRLGVHLANLGTSHYLLGDYRRAVELYEQALAIARDTGDRRSEGISLSNLGLCHSSLGDYDRAVELTGQALAIARDIGDRRGEGYRLSNLGNCHSALGDYRRAVELTEQALPIARDTGDPYLCAAVLNGLGDTRCRLAQWSDAVKSYANALRRAEAGGDLENTVRARCGLAEAHLLAGDAQAALNSLAGIAESDYPPLRAFVELARGLAQIISGDVDGGRLALVEAVSRADMQLAVDPRVPAAHDHKGLALAGLTLTGDADRSIEAVESFRSARAITAATGVAQRVLALLDLLGPYDRTGSLTELRKAASGT